MFSSIQIPHYMTAEAIGATTVGTGGDWSPQHLGWEDQQCVGSPPPNFLAVVFKKQEISQQVVTRMQDLASEFSKIFQRWYPRTLTAGRGDSLPHPTPSPAFGWAQVGWAHLRPAVGTQTLVPLNFSAVVVPLAKARTKILISCKHSCETKAGAAGLTRAELCHLWFQFRHLTP